MSASVLVPHGEATCPRHANGFYQEGNKLGRTADERKDEEKKYQDDQK